MTANSFTVCTSFPVFGLRPVVTPAPDELGKITSRSGGGLGDKITLRSLPKVMHIDLSLFSWWRPPYPFAIALEVGRRRVDWVYDTQGMGAVSKGPFPIPLTSPTVRLNFPPLPCPLHRYEWRQDRKARPLRMLLVVVMKVIEMKVVVAAAAAMATG